MTSLCISPISIPNPNYGVKVIPGSPFSVKDCTSVRISVPCGHCVECIASRQNSLIQRVDMLSTDYDVFFFTLTYNNETIRTVLTSSGFELKYADISDFQKMMKRIRVHNLIPREFKYLLVSERGSLKSRPHFHGLLFTKKVDKEDDYSLRNWEKYLYDVFFKNWSRNVGSDKKPRYIPLFTYHEAYRHGRCYRNFDFHRVIPWTSQDISAPAWYCIKYMLKPSDKEEKLQQALKLNLSLEEYNDVWKLVRSRHVFSKNFATDPVYKEHIRKGIELAKSDNSLFPYFILSNGRTVPLSRVYKSKALFYGLDDALFFKQQSANFQSLDNPQISQDVKHVSELLASSKRGEKLRSISDIDNTVYDD